MNKKEKEFDNVMKFLQMKFDKMCEKERRMKKWIWVPGQKKRIAKHVVEISIYAFIHQTVKASKRIITKK